MTSELEIKQKVIDDALSHNHFRIVEILREILDAGHIALEDYDDEFNKLIIVYDALMKSDHDISMEGVSHD